MSETPTIPPVVPPPPGGGSYTPPPPPPPGGPGYGGPATGGGDRTLMIVLSYLWILALIPLLTKKEDSEVQWHAKHGIVFMVAEIVLWIAFSIVTTIISMASGGLGCVLTLFMPFFSLAILVVHVMAIVKGVNGGRLIIPGVSEYASRF